MRANGLADEYPAANISDGGNNLTVPKKAECSIAACVALLGVALGGCGGEKPATATTDESSGGEQIAASYDGPISSTDVALGQQQYETYCAGCHPGGDEGSGPAIKNLAWSPAQTRKQIREGEDNMPGFDETRISAEALEALLAYLQTLGAVAN